MNTQVIGATLLIANTTIGAGMLALPISVGLSGFIPSFWLLLVGFLFMLYSLLLVFEINLWFPKGTDLISMVDNLLGPTARKITWIGYLLLIYALLCAYIMGITPLIQMVVRDTFNVTAPSSTLTTTLFIISFGYIVYKGTKTVDYLNRPLSIIVFAVFILMMAFSLSNINVKLLEYKIPELVWVSIPLVTVSFLIHIIIPTIREYLNDNVKHITIAATIGLFIPLVFYLLWLVATLAIVPIKGEQGLLTIANSETPTTTLIEAIKSRTEFTYLVAATTVFIMLAIITSFLGIALSLAHFIKDGIKATDNQRSRLVIMTLTFMPPLIFCLYRPEYFVLTLKYAGIIVAILFCIFPVFMAWKGRYLEKRPNNFRMPGGKIALLVVLLGSLLIIFTEIARPFNWLPNATHYMSSSTALHGDITTEEILIPITNRADEAKNL